MIPRKLILKNFFSYKDAILDFDGLHTACICGANGAGKSSLLEAITWAIWGQTRASSADHVINEMEKNARVDFEFSYNHQNYRIIRTRQRNGGATLDFQISNGGNNNQYISLTGKTMTETQETINQYLKIDHDTFINSAYLKQGRADEFMLRKPAERKQILANLLKLDHYDDLEQQAKDLAREYKIKSEELQISLESYQTQVMAKESINLDLQNTDKDLKYVNDINDKNNEKLQQIRFLQNQREPLINTRQWYYQRLEVIEEKFKNLQSEKINLEGEKNKLDKIFAQEDIITNNYLSLQDLIEEDNQLSRKFDSYQEFLAQQRELEEQITRESNNLTLRIQREKANLENLIQQRQESEDVITKTGDLTLDLIRLNECRKKLELFNQIQVNFRSLSQQKQSLESSLRDEETKLKIKLEQLQIEEANLQAKLSDLPQKRQEFFLLKHRLSELENRKNFLNRVKEKGEEQKKLIERYFDSKQTLSKQVEKLHKKIEELTMDDSATCPLCEQDLDDNHLNHVMEKTREEERQIQSESSYYEIEIINCQRELDNLRQEYSQLQQELEKEDENNLRQKFLRLENQLDMVEDIYGNLEKVEEEKSRIQKLLNNGNYAQSLQDELNLINEQIVNLGYSEENHALLIKEERNLRSIEFQEQKIRDAKNKLKKLTNQQPELEKTISNYEQQLRSLQESSTLKLSIDNIKEKIDNLKYDRTYHSQVREKREELQPYRNLYGDLTQAKKQMPIVISKLSKIEENLKDYHREKRENEAKLNKINEQLTQLKDYSQELTELEREAQNLREKINGFLTKKGGLEQQLITLSDTEKKVEELQVKLIESKKQYRIYQELSIAFGKKGIQSLMIDHILTPLQNEANHILNNLSGNQLSVEFITHKPKSTRSKKNDTQVKDTLEIIISSPQGTRAYETYSGGEAFRINFSIRLALSRILAQRAGTPLQLLIVDEGFGTQDGEGCDRLISALNAIAQDFSCILAVTHVAQFKEAFQSRIEVYKTDEGSKIKLCN